MGCESRRKYLFPDDYEEGRRDNEDEKRVAAATAYRQDNFPKRNIFGEFCKLCPVSSGYGTSCPIDDETGFSREEMESIKRSCENYMVPGQLTSANKD